MNTLDIAKKLVELCRQGKNAEARDTLYSEDIVSVEAGAPPGAQRESLGIAAVREKSAWWAANHEIHSANITGPWPHDDRFIVGFQYEVTNKPSGKRLKLDEVGLYWVRNDKIVREEYFYSMG
jgi:hypothetical protein